MFRTIATTTVILALAATASQAGSLNQRSVEVVYGDLNPLHAQDAKILAARLETAAKAVCVDEDPMLAISGYEAEKSRQECIKSAIDVAMARIKGKLDRTVRANFVRNPQ